jgi:hypothetical protein
VGKVAVGVATMWVAGLLVLPVLVLAAVVAAAGLAEPAVGGAAGSPQAGAAAASIPAAAVAAYVSGAASCPGLPWTVLAGIGEVESDHGRSTLPGVASGANAAGAEGPMQFEPATFAAYASGPQASPYDMDDAAVAAARLLCANGGATPAGLPGAIWAYNHSTAYVAEVLAYASAYAGP